VELYVLVARGCCLRRRELRSLLQPCSVSVHGLQSAVDQMAMLNTSARTYTSPHIHTMCTPHAAVRSTADTWAGGVALRLVLGAGGDSHRLGSTCQGSRDATS
jgi:hypothetical protein